ncbi:MAG TPA: PepSY domain-containing protein [Allosphingosinicella sp.]|nr:PepSY domain-containing protein [Allosphingosinicella sp.]
MTEFSLSRSVWRWHVTAGIVVLPVLAWMAITGALYLYKPELERALYRDWIVSRAVAPPMPVADMIGLVEAQTGGRVTQVVRPAAAAESWRMAFTARDGAARMAFVRPDVGLVLGTSRAGGPLELVKELHSLSVLGLPGNLLIELVAGWAILLVLTGFYLWWPRAGGRALSLAGRLGERRFWRNLHASVGALAGSVILFLAVTGMPWTAFWGAGFHAVVARQQIGRPPAPAPQAHGHDAHLPWSLRGAPQPPASTHGDLGPGRAVAAAEARGLAAPWILDLPAAPGRPYRLSAAAERTGDVRILYIDPADARVLQDIGYADFGAGARVFEWGIYTHQGRQYGELNRLVMLAGCIGLLLLALTGPILWWKRRGRGASAGPGDGRRAKGGLIVAATIGILFPLTGASMLLATGLAALLRRLRAAPG